MPEERIPGIWAEPFRLDYVFLFGDYKLLTILEDLALCAEVGLDGGFFEDLLFS